MNPTSGVIGEAWGLYKEHWRHLLAVAFVVYAGVALISAILVGILGWFGAIVASVVALIGLFLVQGALVTAVSDIRDGRADLSLGETFSRVSPRLAAIAVASVLAAIAIAIGLLLLIVPGLVLVTWWVVIIPAIVLEQKRAGESFARSRELVRGHGWNVFGVIVLTILILLGVNIVLDLVFSVLDSEWLQSFVGTIVSGTLTAPFIALVWTLLYYRLRGAREPEAPPAAAAAV